MFGRFQKLVEKMFILLKCLKSQKKITEEDFLEKLVDFIAAWDETFPDCPEFNKLHLLKAHIARFIQKYQMCGRVSAESHESVHAHLAKVSKSCCKMVSTTQQNQTLYARALVNLKPGVAITVDGEEYVTLISGGRIPRRLSVVYLYVKHGIAPDDWVKAFQDSGLLSETKVEVAKYSTH